MSIYFSSQLAALGWDSYFDEKFKRFALENQSGGGIPARVIADYGAEYLAHDGAGMLHPTRTAPQGGPLTGRSGLRPSIEPATAGIEARNG